MVQCGKCNEPMFLGKDGRGALCPLCGRLFVFNFQGKLVEVERENTLARQDRKSDAVSRRNRSADAREVGGRSRRGGNPRVSEAPVSINRSGVTTGGVKGTESNQGRSKSSSLIGARKSTSRPKYRKSRRRDTKDGKTVVRRKKDESGPGPTAGGSKVKKKIDKHYYLIMGGDRSPNHIE